MAELYALCADRERCIRVAVRWNLFDATVGRKVQGVQLVWLCRGVRCLGLVL
jgi:hypothetical protein